MSYGCDVSRIYSKALILGVAMPKSIHSCQSLQTILPGFLMGTEEFDEEERGDEISRSSPSLLRIPSKPKGMGYHPNRALSLSGSQDLGPDDVSWAF